MPSEPTPDNVETPELFPKAERLFSVDRLAVLASGSGSTFEAIGRAVRDGEIPASYLVLVSNNANAGALARADRLGIESIVVDWDEYEDHAEHDRVVTESLLEQKVGLVFLAGYMRKIGSTMLNVYKNRILNTHPALLEDDPGQRKYGGEGMFGSHVHEAVFQNGDQVSGASVHLVDGEFDHGPVLQRAEVNISEAQDADEVSTLVQGVEKPLVVSVVRDVISGRVTLP